MFNPFKKRYKVDELNNIGGTKFVPTYSNLFWDLISQIDDNIKIYVSSGGGVSEWKHWFPSLEEAKRAIENHKLEKEKEYNSRYKKTATHYVE